MHSCNEASVHVWTLQLSSVDATTDGAARKHRGALKGLQPRHQSGLFFASFADALLLFSSLLWICVPWKREWFWWDDKTGKHRLYTQQIVGNLCGETWIRSLQSASNQGRHVTLKVTFSISQHSKPLCFVTHQVLSCCCFFVELVFFQPLLLLMLYYL